MYVHSNRDFLKIDFFEFISYVCTLTKTIQQSIKGVSRCQWHKKIYKNTYYSYRETLLKDKCETLFLTR